MMHKPYGFYEKYIKRPQDFLCAALAIIVFSPVLILTALLGGQSNAYIAGDTVDVGADIFKRGLCLPSDNKMTEQEQDVIIDIIHRCFR